MGNFILKGKTPVKKTVLSFFIVAVLELAAFYVLMPAMNIHSMEFWGFQGFFAVAFLALTFSFPSRDRLEVRYNIVSKIVGILIILAIVFVIAGNIISAKLFNAGRYASLMEIKETKFEDTIGQRM